MAMVNSDLGDQVNFSRGDPHKHRREKFYQRLAGDLDLRERAGEKTVLSSPKPHKQARTPEWLAAKRRRKKSRQQEKRREKQKAVLRQQQAYRRAKRLYLEGKAAEGADTGDHDVHAEAHGVGAFTWLQFHSAVAEDASIVMAEGIQHLDAAAEGIRKHDEAAGQHDMVAELARLAKDEFASAEMARKAGVSAAVGGAGHGGDTQKLWEAEIDDGEPERDEAELAAVVSSDEEDEEDDGAEEHKTKKTPEALPELFHGFRRDTVKNHVGTHGMAKFKPKTALPELRGRQDDDDDDDDDDDAEMRAEGFSGGSAAETEARDDGREGWEVAARQKRLAQRLAKEAEDAQLYPLDTDVKPVSSPPPLKWLSFGQQRARRKLVQVQQLANAHALYKARQAQAAGKGTGAPAPAAANTAAANTAANTADGEVSVLGIPFDLSLPGGGRILKPSAYSLRFLSHCTLCKSNPEDRGPYSYHPAFKPPLQCCSTGATTRHTFATRPMLVKSDPKNVKAYDSPYCGSWEVPHSIVVRDFTGREEALAFAKKWKVKDVFPDEWGIKTADGAGGDAGGVPTRKLSMKEQKAAKAKAAREAEKRGKKKKKKKPKKPSAKQRRGAAGAAQAAAEEKEREKARLKAEALERLLPKETELVPWESPLGNEVARTWFGDECAMVLHNGRVVTCCADNPCWVKGGDFTLVWPLTRFYIVQVGCANGVWSAIDRAGRTHTFAVERGEGRERRPGWMEKSLSVGQQRQKEKGEKEKEASASGGGEEAEEAAGEMGAAGEAEAVADGRAG